MTSSFITTLGQVAELIAEFRLLHERDSVSPETLGFILRRIVDLTEQGIVPALDNNASGLDAVGGRVAQLELKEVSLRYRVDNLESQLTGISDQQSQMGQNIYKVTQIATAANSATMQLSSRLDAIVGENASQAIDNFNEIISFLDGVKDDASLVALLSDMHSDIEANREAIANLRKIGGGSMPEINTISDANGFSIIARGNNTIAEIDFPIAEAPNPNYPGCAGIITASDFQRISQLPTSAEIDQLRLDISAATPTVSMDNAEVVEACDNVFKK